MYKKVYRVKSMQDAITKIKEEMGPEAEIIDERKVNQKGVLGFLKSKEYEVIAVISREEREKFLRRKQTSRAGVIGNDVNISALMSELNKKKQTPQMANPIQSVQTIKPEPFTTMTEPTEPAVKEPQPNFSQLDSEIKELKGMLVEFMKKEPQPRGVEAMYEEAKTRFNDLMDKYEFTPYVREEFISFLKVNEVSLSEVTEEWVRLFVKEAVNQVVEIDEEESSSQVKLFVGPPGVGKTTTIAKIAAIEKKRNGKKVAFITVDEYRIGAVEQLRKYAKISKIPLRVVKTKEALDEALEYFSNYDLIIVDSTGRSQRDSENLLKMNELLEALNTDDVYLVLSASSKRNELFKIMDEFEAFNYNKLVLTKLDENERNELILNIAMERDYPFSYFCNGQKVPRNIEKATKERAIELIIGEGEAE